MGASMISYLPFLGSLLGFLGTYIVAIPDIDQKHRVRFYKIHPQLRELYTERQEVRRSSIGDSFFSKKYTIRYSLLDHLFQKGDIKENLPIPDGVVIRTDQTILLYDDRDKRVVDSHGLARQEFVEVLDLALRYRCRTIGLKIAAVGIGLIAIANFLV